MEERGFYKEPTDPTKRVLTDEASDIISGLRLQLIFPQIEFESDEPSITNLSIDFEYFYPIDKGPLIPKERPIPQEYIDMKRLELKSLGIRLRPSEGLWLHLPADANKLAQIKAKFVLKPKQ